MLSNLTWIGIILTLLIISAFSNAINDRRSYKTCESYEHSPWKCEKCNNFNCSKKILER